MVYQRYIYKDGKKIGPYFYKSVRGKDGRVKSVYVGSAAESPAKKHYKNFVIGFLVAAFAFLLIFSFSIFNEKTTGFSIAGGGSAEIDPQVNSVIYDDGAANVIIELKENNDINVAQQEVLSSLSTSEISIQMEGKNVSDFELKHAYEGVNALSGRISADGLKALENNPDVKRIYIDQILQIDLQDSVPLIGADDLLSQQINGVNVSGEGSAVCVIDTGVDATHPAFAGRVVGQYCFCSISGSPCCPNGQAQDDHANDDNGHGTHVAGIIASNDATYQGVAPGANIVAVKVCNSQGQCTSSDIIAALDKCLEVASANNIDAISMSIGGGSYSSYCDSVSPAMTTAINNAASAGIFVAIASGNSGYSDKIAWPSCVQSAVAVGAVEKTDAVASYSNRNSLIDLMAPGGSGTNPITSASISGGFIGKYGTSMATPHAAGAAILLQHYNRLYNGQKLRLSELIGLLKATGQSIYDSGSSRNYSRVDVNSAAGKILKIDESANSAEKVGVGKVTFSSSTNMDSISEALSIGENSISLDSSSWPAFNKAATLEIYGLSFAKMPVVLKNGNVCSDCSSGSYSGGNFSFNVAGFSNYSADVNANLTGWDESNANRSWYTGKARPGREVHFYADYISRASGNEVSDGSCDITFSDSSGSMSFNSSKNAFEFSRNFSIAGNYSYSIYCSQPDFESLNVSDSVFVSKSTPIIRLKLKGQERDISVIMNSNVDINATLAEPAGEQLKLYMNGDLMSQGTSSITDVVLFNSYGSNNVTAIYDGSDEYLPLSKTFWVNVIADNEAPLWTVNTNSSGTYGEDNRFNITWGDNVELSNVWIESNIGGSFSNDSMSTDGTNYYYTYPNAPVGSYSWRGYANDTSGNINATSLMTYEIQRAQNQVDLFINGNKNQNVALTYQKVNITATASSDTASIFKNNATIANSFFDYLDVGNYTIKVNSSGNENYTDNSSGISFNLNVSKAPAVVELRLKGNRASITTATGKSVELSAKLTAPSSGTIKILVNNIAVKEGSSQIAINKTFSANSNVTASYSGSANYASDSESFNVKIVSDSSSSSSSGGGAGAESIASSCVSLWTCSAWSACTENIQTTSCKDLNNCETPTSAKPAESQSCVSQKGCTESWQCPGWGACVDGKQRRTCNDLSLCGQNIRDEEQACAEEILAAPKTVAATDWKTTALGFTGKVTSTVKELSLQYAEEIKKEPVLALPLVGLFGFLGYSLYSLSLTLISLYR